MNITRADLIDSVDGFIPNSCIGINSTRYDGNKIPAHISPTTPKPESTSFSFKDVVVTAVALAYTIILYLWTSVFGDTNPTIYTPEKQQKEKTILKSEQQKEKTILKSTV